MTVAWYHDETKEIAEWLTARQSKLVRKRSIDWALRFINNDFTPSQQALLTSSNTSPLHVRRMKQMASEVYITVNDIAADYIKHHKVKIQISGKKIGQVFQKTQGMY